MPPLQKNMIVEKKKPLVSVIISARNEMPNVALLGCFVAVVIKDVLRLIAKYLKIFWSIITKNIIFVMNDFFFSQGSAKFIFHDKTVFSNIPTFWNKNMNITSFIYHFSFVSFIKTFLRAINSSLAVGLANRYEKYLVTNFTNTKNFAPPPVRVLVSPYVFVWLTPKFSHTTYYMSNHF